MLMVINEDVQVLREDLNQSKLKPIEDELRNNKLVFGLKNVKFFVK